jgi:Kef-type K+ transport system membrane component KefB/mannitol/fructose-specific phosphotransferase system IIA component (Ntr-type)/nucleotide-binding universal stress UspA family protein
LRRADQVRLSSLVRRGRGQLLARRTPMSFPITSPVLIVAVAMGIFLVAPMLMQRIRVPGLIGIIVSGAIVGPNGLNLLARDQTIVLLGTVGLLYLMFMAGIEIDLHGLRRYRNQSLTFGTISYLLPQTVGIGLGLLLGYSLPASILLASMFGSHTLVAYPIAMRLGIAKNRAVTTAVGGTIITDASALMVLAIVAASTQGALDAGFWLRLTVLLSLYLLLIWVALPRLARWFFRHERSGGTPEYVFILTALFGGAYLAEVVGVQPIVGAFLVGLALNRLIPEQSILTNRVHFVGNAFFIPFFLLSVGMLVDVRVLSGNIHAWKVMLGMTATVTVTKWAAARLTAKIFGYTGPEGSVIFGLSVPQAAATLAATLIGYEIGLFDDAVLNGAIMMILFTCLIGPWTVEKLGRQLALDEEQAPFDPRQAPQRILVPMSNPATAKDLMDLALMIRLPNSTEPIYPLTVVPADPDRSAEYVATAEKMLSHAVTYAAGADVPVTPVTRMDHNFASGIARGLAETRSSTLVIGWDGNRRSRRLMFGSVLDQLLEQTRQLVLVAKLGHPLNTTGRLVVLIPRGADHVPGFLEAVQALKLLGNRLGATIVGYTVDSPPDLYRAHFTSVKPDVDVRFQRISAWRDVIERLPAELRPDDLVIVLSSRRGSIPWTPVFERLPARLADLVPESFIMMYPSEVAPELTTTFRQSGLPSALSARRILVGLPAQDSESAMRALLATQFSEEPGKLEVCLEELTRNANAFVPEIRPGVMVPHGRAPDLDQGMIFLATSQQGITFPNMDDPARLLFVVLTAEGEPQEHLNHLAEIATLVSDPERERRLLEATSVDEILAVGIGEIPIAELT